MSNALFQDLVIEEFLEGQPRAEDWSGWKEALHARLRDALAHREALPADDAQTPLLDARIAELREQVAALATEAAVTRFVEDSVRASLIRPRDPGDSGDRDDEDEFAIDEADQAPPAGGRR